MTVGTRGALVKSSVRAIRAFIVPIISLVILGIVIWNVPALVVAQSAVTDDVKHDSPGQVIKHGQSLHIDVDLALVNVTVTDPYDRQARLTAQSHLFLWSCVWSIEVHQRKRPMRVTDC
jgi:hypothetical protein